jgi:hypothetical protein
MAVAYVAYQHLSPEVKVQVDAILKQHPDYETWVKDLPFDADRGLEAFLQSSYWPDQIKGDPRFWDDLVHGAQPTPQLPGFPDMKMHKNWHYTNVPYITNGQAGKAAEVPNIWVRINELRHEPLSAYNMMWLVHLVGDIHQPLHCVARFSGHHLDDITKRDRGDLGGNLVQLDDPAKNLHALWDDALGKNDSRAELSATAASLTAPADSVVRLDTNSWVEESVQLAKDLVYSIGPDADGSPVPTVPPAYRSALQKVARERIGLAGYRLAAILNNRLQ